MLRHFIHQGNSIKQRLNILIISICLISLLVASVLMTWFQLKEYEQSLAENMTVLARITAGNVQAALLFDSPEDAESIVSEFKEDPRIVQAVIYRADGKSIFSEYHRENIKSISIPEMYPTNNGYHFEKQSLHIGQNIRLGDSADDFIGHIYLNVSLDSIYQQLYSNISITGLIIFLSLLLCYFLSTRLQKIISKPIHELSETTQKIRTDKDYSLRVDNRSYMEMHHLCDGFNAMLEEIQQRDNRLQKLASFDTLTGLANRTYFNDILAKATERGLRKHYQHAVLFLDLDRFKRINDSLGHTIGDELLIQLSHRLQEILRGEDTIARLGGDEFTILLQDINDSAQAAEVSERILKLLKKPFKLYGHTVVISPSIGIVIFPEHGRSPEELMRNADIAMYKAKHSGGNDYYFFNRELTNLTQKRLKLEGHLQHAVEKDEITLFYQPKLSLQDNTIIGVESLCRWMYKQEQLISPGEFLPLADETGLIIPIGNEITHQAIAMLNELNKNGYPDICMAINMSARQIKNCHSIELLYELIQNSGINPKQIEIEITEEALIDYTDEFLATLFKFKEHGLSLAIDDFGTGYSSLSYLKQFPFDVLKIDMSFIKGIEHDEKSRDIVKAMIDMSHSLGLKVVAEGVETEEQLYHLREMSCDVIQGYYLSRPCNKEDLWDFLGQEKKSSVI